MATTPSSRLLTTGRPASAKTREHARVLRQRLRGERLELPGPGERDEVLKQQRGDAPVVHGVRDREGDLGRLGRPVPRHLEAGEPDDLAVVEGEQGGVVGPWSLVTRRASCSAASLLRLKKRR